MLRSSIHDFYSIVEGELEMDDEFLDKLCGIAYLGAGQIGFDEEELEFLKQYVPTSSVTVYRGLALSSLKPPLKGTIRVGDAFTHKNQEDYSSWTHDIKITERFALNQTEYGIILEARIAPRDLLIDFTLLPQTLVDKLHEQCAEIFTDGKFLAFDEKEVLVSKPQVKAKIVKILHREESGDSSIEELKV